MGIKEKFIQAFEQTASESGGIAIPGSAQKVCECNPWGHDSVVNMVVLG